MKNHKEFAINLAKQAGEMMRKNFVLGMKKEWKEDNTPLTITDVAINDLVMTAVKKDYPGYGLIAEEGSDYNGEEYTWVCDPIDGTIPFAHGVPTFTFMLALVVNGKSILGVIYDPFLDNLYYAAKGEGAYLNGRKISVSSSKELKQTALGMITWSEAKYKYWGLLEDLLEHKIFDFRIPSAGYMDVLVANGEFSAVIFPGDSPWDAAAPKIIVEEAGGKFTDLFGEEPDFTKKIRGYLASNGILHDYLLSLIKKHLRVEK